MLGGASGCASFSRQCGSFGVVVGSVINDCICIVSGMAVGDSWKRTSQGILFGGVIVVGTLGHVAWICSAVGALGVGAAVFFMPSTKMVVNWWRSRWELSSRGRGVWTGMDGSVLC